MKKILVVEAHADDAVLSCGGTIAKFISQGDIVWTITVTKSDCISYDGIILRTEQQAKEEGVRSFEILGVQKMICLNYPNKQVPFNYRIIESLSRWIDIFNPDLIIAHHLSSSHPDHINTCKCVLATSRYQKNIWMMEPLYPDKMTNQPFHPIIYVNISNELDKKIKALKEHKSQWKKYPHWEELITSLAKLRGIETGIFQSLAESFEPIKIYY